MYHGLRRQSGLTGIAGAHARRTPVLAHEGRYSDVIGRHEIECRSIQSESDRRQLLAKAFERITDERMLMATMDNLGRGGPKAAGRNGIRLCDLDPHERWGLAQQLRDLLRSGNYRRGPTRNKKIPKGHGKPGFRTLKIPNIEDQVVQKAVVLILQPILDPRLDDRSFGFRPRRGREHALAMALNLYKAGYQTLILEDLRNAFDTVPHSRLLEVLRRYRLPPQTVDLIARCIANGNDTGLSQGGCLSPLLLNLYLDHHLDRRWRRQMPDSPLIRYADDLCILCRSREDGRNAYARLYNHIRPTGMRLRGSPETTIHDLGVPNATAVMLGYQLTANNGELRLGVADVCWESLDDHLRTVHHREYPSVSAYQTICGWVDQMGLCLPTGPLTQLHQRIAATAHRYGFEEIPAAGLLEAIRDTAATRFARIRRESTAGSADGSAQWHENLAAPGHASEAPWGASTTDCFGVPPT